MASTREGRSVGYEDRHPTLLHQRFHVVAHTETRFSRGQAPCRRRSSAPHTHQGRSLPAVRIHVRSGQMRGVCWSMPQLANYLTPAARFPVVDQAGLTSSTSASAIAPRSTPTADSAHSTGPQTGNRPAPPSPVCIATSLRATPCPPHSHRSTPYIGVRDKRMRLGLCWPTRGWGGLSG